MSQNRQITITRALAAEFLKRKIAGFALVLAVALVVFTGVAVWLTTYSQWWWLLAALLVLLTVISFLAFLGSHALIKALRPTLTQQQSKLISDFVDKLERVTDVLGTPMFMIVFYVIRGTIIRSSGAPYLQTIAQDASSIKQDYALLLREF